MNQKKYACSQPEQLLALKLKTRPSCFLSLQTTGISDLKIGLVCRPKEQKIYITLFLVGEFSKAKANILHLQTFSHQWRLVNNTRVIFVRFPQDLSVQISLFGLTGNHLCDFLSLGQWKCGPPRAVSKSGTE